MERENIMFKAGWIRPNLAAVLLLLATIATLENISLGQTANPPLPLPDEDRQTLNEYLGNVVGAAVSPPALADGLYDLLPIRDGIAWRERVISGKAAGADQEGSARLLNHGDGTTRFRIDTGDGRNVLYGQLDSNGSLLCYASQDNQEGVISRFSPAQPIFLADLAPGQTRHMTSHISVADLSSPDVESHSGNLNIDFTYVGAYRLHVPAGTFDAVLMKTTLAGKVGPADVHDTIYRFFARNAPLVAMVETDDISAMLVYHERTRIGKVLVETIGR